MSRFSGKQYKGAMRELREIKRHEAVARNRSDESTALDDASREEGMSPTDED